MKFNAKWLGIAMVLMMLLMAPALSATAQPVLVLTDYRVVPAASVTAATASAPLMPGDTGTVLVTLTNTFKGTTQGSTSSQTDTYNYGSGTSNGVTTPAHSSTTTTSDTNVPQGCMVIKSVALLGSGPIRVVSEPYANPGCLGSGDSARFDFTIQADGSAADGKYYLPLVVRTDNDGVFLNQVVPVVVDSSGIRVVVNEAPATIGAGASNVVLDVVNYMAGGVNSVSVVPSGDGFTFKPVQEYTVGSIGAGEMYTVTFSVASRNATGAGTPSFVVKYKNGDNWHQTAPVSLRLDAGTGSATTASDGSGLLVLLAGIVVLAAIIGGLFLYMRNKRSKQ